MQQRETRLWPPKLLPVNLCDVAIIADPLIMGNAAPTRRGKAFILANVIVPLALAFLEIAHI